MDDQIIDQDNRQDFPENFNKPRTGAWEWIINHNLVVIGGILLIILAVFASLWFIRNQREKEPESTNVLLNIKGPESIPSGNETEFRVIYTNGENADLTNISLEVFYPSNFKFVSSEPGATSSNGQRYNLPILAQGQTGEIKIRGKVNGATGESKELKAKLIYSLSNFSSEFTTETSYKTVLTAPALEMEITGPIDVTNGQATTFAVKYKNVSDKEFEAIGMELNYPESFKFTSANPSPSKNNNFWNLGKLAVGASGQVEVTGNFIGDPGSESQIGGDLGLALATGLAPQIHASARFKIQASSLSLTQTTTPGEVVELGQTIQYSLKYGNYGAVSQSNVVITATLDGASLDMSKIKASSGIVTGNTITWKSATVSNLSLLSPNQTGELTFSVPVKPSIATNLANQVIKNTTSIYSDQITSPIRGQDIELKLASELGMIVSGSYVGGALPMKVGEATTFNISILVTNLGNKLSDVTVIGSMPLPASAWVNVITPDSEKANLTFDKNASKIRWRIGDLAPFVGKFSPARIANFQLTVIPSEGDQGRTMTLLKDVQTTGTDTFIGKDIESTELDQLTVSDLEDDVIESKGATVE